MVTNGARTSAGIRPSVTIGSENTMRISLASARLAISPVGPALTMVSGRAGARLRHRRPLERPAEQSDRTSPQGERYVCVIKSGGAEEVRRKCWSERKRQRHARRRGAGTRRNDLDTAPARRAATRSRGGDPAW